MLDWVGTDQPMKMRATSRAKDKKLWGNNNSVVDSGYRGEWFVAITNTNDIPIVISKSATQVNVNKNRITYPYNKAIAQAVLLPVPRTTVQEISFEELQSIPSERGTGKVGSSKK